MKVSYNWLQNYFEEKLPNPEKIMDGIIFHSFEVESLDKIEIRGKKDWIFDIKILPDRAHDCLSHFGIAKEIGMIFDLKIKDQIYKIFGNKKTELEIEVKDDRCLRYMGRIIRNIKVAESPEWLKEKLNAIGQKSINNIVDSANFVMFDLGQPIHAFDLDKLESPKILIRNAKNVEKITTLDKKEVNLDESILVIADDKDTLAIAGIKGGTKAEVDNNTKNIVIEVANFNSTSIRKTAKKINILTDAEKRYENDISPRLCTKAMDAITHLIYFLAGGEVEDIIDIYKEKIEQKIVLVSVDYINKRLGSNFSKEEIKSVWEKLNFEYIEKNNNFEIKIPFLRRDIDGSHDLVEEVIRVLGYDRLEEKLPEIKIEKKINEDFNKMFLVRNYLLNEGYNEILTYTFRDKGEVEVLASASDKKYLRNNLKDGLLESLKLNELNAPLLGEKEIKIFEIGTVFLKGKEEMNVAWNEKKEIKEMTLDNFCISKNFVSKDLASESIEIKNQNIPQNNKKFKMWSLYPFIVRDIALWVPENVMSDEIEKIIKENINDLVVKGPDLFDSFKKADKISYAFRLVFQSYDRTLTIEEVNILVNKITEKLKENKDWELR